MQTDSLHIEEFLEACRMWPWADEDIIQMQDGDLYVFGMAFFEQLHDVRGLEHCYCQAWLVREKKCWRYRAFSTLQHTKKRTPINTSGTFTLNDNGNMCLSDSQNAHESVTLAQYIRACRHLHLVKKTLSEEQNSFFMYHGFRALMSGLWLDKQQRTRKKLLAIDENGAPLACHYDFGDEPLLIQRDEINESIKERQLFNLKRGQDTLEHLRNKDQANT